MLGKREVPLIKHKDSPHSRSVSPAPVAMATRLEEKVLQTLHSVREGVSIPAEISCSLPVRIFAALNFRGCELSLHGRQFDASGSATCESVGRRERESDAEREIPVKGTVIIV